MKAYLEKLLKINEDEPNAQVFITGYGYLLFHIDGQFQHFYHGEEQEPLILNQPIDKKRIIFGEKLGYVSPNDGTKKWTTLTFYELPTATKKFGDKADPNGHSVFRAYDILLNDLNYFPILLVTDAILLKIGGPVVVNMLIKDTEYRAAIKNFLQCVNSSKEEDFSEPEMVYDIDLLKKYFPDRF